MDASPKRDYRPDASKVHASVFVVHGINDQNVTTNQFGDWWPLFAARGVPRKIWLSQDGHVDPFDYRRGVWVRTLHRWFDYWLQGLPNGIMGEPQATVERADGHWTTQSSWPAPGTRAASVPLSQLGGTAHAHLHRSTVTVARPTAVATPNQPAAGRACSPAACSPARCACRVRRR